MSVPSECPGDELVLALLDDTISDEDRARILRHSDSCASCRELLAGAAGGLVAPEPPGATVDAAGDGVFLRGLTLGRYVILDLLGAGAMGIVHSAYDPELDRKIAIKLLRGGGGRAPRLVQEAKALARLSHPNVVGVHDVGTLGDDVFIAMELVEGRDLRAWLRDRPRGWREVLEVFVAAGRGLAGAHRAGIVHRDFKAENVLVGDDGGVRVADFGLAHVGPGEAPEAFVSGASPALPVIGALTRTGDLLGTPAYMAPEQMRGQPATTASDQFGFCVALHEALFGQRPFAGNRLEELLASMEGERLVPAKRRGVPTRVRRAVLRGARARPEDRFPSMDALLAELDRAPRAVWRWAGAVVAVLGVIGGGVWLDRRAMDARTTVCADAGAELAAIWTPDRRAAVKAAILAGDAPYAAAAWATFARTVDQHVAESVAASREACEATHVRRTQPAELLELRARCLGQQRQQLRALVEVMSRPGPRLADWAAQAAFALSPAAECAGSAVLAARGRVARATGATRERADELGATMATVMALIRAGRLEPALAAALLLPEAARALRYPPVEAEAWRVLANAQLQRRRIDDAAESFRRAYHAAAVAGDDARAGMALTNLVRVVGFQQWRPAEAARLVEDARVILERVGDERLLGNLLLEEGILRFEQGDMEGAGQRFERLIELRERSFGREHPQVAIAINARGKVHWQAGRRAEARADFERALAIDEKLLGPSHPEVATKVSNLAELAWEEADYPAAGALFDRAVTLTAARGAATPDVGGLLVSFGAVTADAGDHAAGMAMMERGLELVVRGRSPEHANTIGNRLRVARSLTELGRYDEARPHLEAAVAATADGEPSRAALALAARALLRIEIGEPAGALADARGAAAICERESAVGPGQEALVRAAHCRVLGRLGERAGPEVCAAALRAAEEARGTAHPLVAQALASLGEAELAAGQPDRARPYLERALAFLEPRPGDVEIRARARFALARALGPADPRALDLARRARADRIRIGSRDLRPVEDIDRWIAGRP